MKSHTRLQIAVSAILLSASAMAADPSQLEEVVVTGSRIRGEAPVGSTVIDIDREAITNSGGITVDRIIKEIPQVFNLGVTESSRGQAGGAGNITWSNTINLHAVGPYATLVLLDGHRAVSNSRSIDPSFVPSLGLERIEIVADGASAVYGSDAIAGVVNLIPRRTLDGIETSFRYGEGDNFDESQFGLALGKVWSSGQIMFAFEHAKRSALSGDDRDFYTSDQRASGGTDYRVTRCNPGTMRIGTTSYAIPQGGVTPANAASLVAGTANRCDDLPGQDLLPEQEYDTVNATYTQGLTDTIELFADGFYSKRVFQRTPAYASSTLAVPATNAFFTRPPGTTAATTIDYNFINDLPRDVQTGSSTNWEVTPGIRIKLPHDFQFEALYTYGKSDDQSNSYRGLNTTALATALASGTAAAAFDPYGLNRTSAATLAAISDQVFLAPTLTDFKGYEARFNGSLFDLPGGKIRVAAGYEGQEMAVSLGLARGGPTTPIVYRNFSRRVDSVYAEFFVPIIGDANNMSGAQRLELTAAVRYDEYDDVGNTTNPKFGINYVPIDGLKFRATYGTSFRAPLISEIYGNSNALFGQSYQNPAGGAALPGFALSGGNTDLKPEEATTWTAGVDWQPTDSTTVSVTYFDIEYEKQVANFLSNLAVLTFESEFAGTNIILHGTQARDRVLALLAQGITLARGSFPGGDPNNVTLFVDGRGNNLGVSIINGIDFQIAQRWDTGSAGSFAADLGGTYFTKCETSLTPNGTRVDRLNTIFNPLQLKLRAGLTWNYSAFTTQLVVNYVNGYDNNAVTPVQAVDSYMPVDLTVRLNGDNVDWLGEFGKGFSVGLEARNVLDTDPPYVNIAQSVNGGGGFDPTAANPVGRLIAVTLRKNF
jgi:iron complex outermembrane receptor protein